MNASLEQSIIERLHDLDDARLAEVFDFVEFLRSRPPRSLQAMTGLLSASATGSGEEVMEVLREMTAERAVSVDAAEHLIQK
ncbi:MAG: hypothetical protein Q7T36_16190 [Fluviicoccus sp.]|uniref:hypothetical protein n=1 Tax=Fluviicoccus sp. TaxID=2003552 RepID=UPI002723CBAE|nr:hypothetical protein [Fluviicoccus sp.]MDO8332006.1 hypothetical protein [Fluviicoccus sp.]